MRRIEVFKDTKEGKAKELLFIKDDFPYSEEFDAECPKGSKEEREFTIDIPDRL